MVLEFSKSCRADVKDSFEQSKMRVVSSTYLLNLISFSCKNALNILACSDFFSCDLK